MELSRYRHLFYFSEQPIPFIEQCFLQKQIAFTHIDSSDPDAALAEAQRLCNALLAHPDFHPEGIGLLCFGTACALALQLQEFLGYKLLLVNPQKHEYFATAAVIEGQTQEEIFQSVKEKLENLD